LDVISIHGSQKDARNIEQGFAPDHRNVNCLHEQEVEGHQHTGTAKSEASIVTKPVIELECETKRVPLDLRAPDKVVMISQDLSPEEETELLSFLNKNNDIFAWRTNDLTGVRRSINTSSKSTPPQSHEWKSFTKCLTKRKQQLRWRSRYC
jgi:hypothetical protein